MSDTECDTNPETTDGPGDEPTDAEVSAEIGNIFNEILGREQCGPSDVREEQAVANARPAKPETLGLWSITDPDGGGYDTYDSAVVCAATEHDARRICPNHFFSFRWCDDASTWVRTRMGEHDLAPHDEATELDNWTTPDKVTAVRVGDAGPDMKPGEIVCASYNAG